MDSLSNLWRRPSSSQRLPGSRLSTLQTPARLVPPVGKRASRTRSLALAVLCATFFAPSTSGRDRWTDLNIGPFFVLTDGDPAPARQTLNDLEQLRWMLGNLLENQDLRPLWPLRVIISQGPPQHPGIQQVRDNYLLVLSPGAKVPLDVITRLFLDDATPPLPPEVEEGLPLLFSTLEAKGSRVTWGAPPAQPNLNWARLQLFATKPEYAGRFHVFITNVRNGTSLSIAASNAFAKSLHELDEEARARLTSSETVTVGARPLDPKRDVGERPLDPLQAALYLADTQLASDPEAARAVYREASDKGGALAAQGFEGLALLNRQAKKNDHLALDDAMSHGSRSAAVYVYAAENQSPQVAIDLLKKAILYNPYWAEPYSRQADITQDLLEKEAYLVRAVKLAPRSVESWIWLAQTQTANKHFVAAQGSWLRAEAAARTPAERAKIQALHSTSETDRLDAAERERRERRAAEEADLARVRDANLKAIHDAESNANKSLSAASDAPAANPVPWWDEPNQRSIAGQLTRVECLGAITRFRIGLPEGGTTTLVIRDATRVSVDGLNSSYSCGPQEPPRSVSVVYSAKADRRLSSDGDILSLHFK